MNIEDDIANALEDAGIGTVGTDIWLGQMPFDEDNGINVVLIGGGRSSENFALFDVDMEIWVRNTDDDTARSKIQEIYDYLQRKGNFTTDNGYVYFVHSQTDIEDVEKDVNGRRRYRSTFRVIYRDSSIS